MTDNGRRSSWSLLLIWLGTASYINVAGSAMNVAYGLSTDPSVTYVYGLISATGLIAGTWCFIRGMR